MSRLYLLTIACFVLVVSSLLVLAQPTNFRSRGPGGGGALFLPSFNPGAPGEISLACDMSESFHTSNYGREWTQTNFRYLQTFNNRGLIQFTKDPSIQYTIDATSLGGSDTFRPTKSTDGGKTWKVIATDPTSGGAQYLYASFNTPNTVVIADYKNVYATQDGGATWRKIYSTNNSAGIHIAGALFFEPDIFIGLSTGVLTSSDAGATFQYRKDLTGLDTTTQAIFSFTGGQTVGIRTTTTLYAAVHASGDVYGGVTALDRPAFQGIYTLSWDVKKWVKKVSGISATDQPYFVAMSSQQESTCFAAGGSANSVPTVLKTADGGTSWVETFQSTNNKNIVTGWSGSGGDRQWSYGEYALGFAVNPNNKDEAVFTDLGYAHLTRDGGASWSQIYVSPSSENPAGSATPKGKSYQSVGLENTTCWRIVWLDSLNMYGCYSDIQGTRSTDGGLTWGFNYTGHSDNSLYCVVKHTTTGTTYGATGTVHDMYQSTYLQDSRIDNGKGKVLFSTNNGAAWQLMHDFAHPVVWLALDKTNAKRMYASVIHSSQGGVYVSNNIDAGNASTWTKLPVPPRTEGHPFNLVVLDDGTLVASYSGRRDGSGKFTASSGIYVWNGTSWADKSDAGMQYWTKDIVIDPNDATQNTWYVGVFSGWGGAPNGKGGLYRSSNRGGSWTRINALDRVTSLSFDPRNKKQAYMTTETDGLWFFSDITTSNPTATLVNAYPFRQPERVFFNPYKPEDVWVSSFGNGMKCSAADVVTTLEVPTLALPAQNASVLSRKVWFNWACSWTPISYRLQISSDALFATTIVDTRVSDTRHFTYFTAGGDYYWRAKAYSTTDSSGWSTAWTMNIQNTISAATNLSPLCASIDQKIPVQLRWAQKGDAYEYTLVIASDSLLKNVVLDSALLASYTSCIFKDAKPFTKYYWCIYDRGVEVGGEGSDTCSFTTGDLQSDVELDYPTISLYPQPASSLLTIRYSMRVAQRIQIRLLDESGKVITRETSNVETGDCAYSLDCESLPNGAYYMVITGSDGVMYFSKTLIVLH